MVSEVLKTAVKKIISDYAGRDVAVHKMSPVGGGCINDAHRVETGAGTFFMKHNDARRYPGMFEAEARGLELLAGSSSVDVPRVTGYGTAGDQSLLVLEFLASGRQKPEFWEEFGQALAMLHRNTPQDVQKKQGINDAFYDGAAKFGLDHDNYIGSLPQSNRPHRNWPEFFVSERLEPQLRMARDSRQAGRDMVMMFEGLYRHIPDFFPGEPPALLHGDLWSGNYMTGPEGRAVVIDPAVYFGHRYMDLGMSKLFGGFPQEFYTAYNHAYPLDRSWTQSMDIANTYPLMVHVNLFGGSYASSVKSIIKRFR